jgi:hypothetical protein
VGLLIGLATGWVVALPIASVLSAGRPSTGGSATILGSGTGVVLYYVVIAAAGGLMIGWWKGLRRGVRRVVTASEVPETLVSSLLRKVFSGASRRGLDPEKQAGLPTSFQEKLAAMRGAMTNMTDHGVSRLPGLSVLLRRATDGVVDSLAGVPSRLAEQVAPGNRPGDLQGAMEVYVAGELRRRIDSAVVDSFRLPLLFTTVVLVLLAMIPFAVLPLTPR